MTWGDIKLFHFTLVHLWMMKNLNYFDSTQIIAICTVHSFVFLNFNQESEVQGSNEYDWF